MAADSPAPSRWRMVADTLRVLDFFAQLEPIRPAADMRAIGLERDGELVAGAIYEGFNGYNVWVHLAGIPGARWMTRDFLRYGFVYPFCEMGVRRLSGYVNASNLAARQLNEHLGYRVEATLAGAAPDGGDVLVYVMHRQDCRFIPKEARYAFSQHRI